MALTLPPGVTPYYQEESIAIVHGDCRDVLPMLAAGSIDAILTDPPFFGVLEDHWDNAWTSRTTFLEWVRGFFDEWLRVLRFNGSLFMFAYPSMAAHIEVLISKRFNVLNHIVWNKTNGGSASRNDKSALRSFIPLSERIIFAEHYGADNRAKGEAGYLAKCDELRGFVFEPLRKYLADEFSALGWNAEDLNRICGTASMAGRHFTARSQWCLPTADHYAKLQAAANGHLRREYEDLRREYEDLRREYEDLRRPFAITSCDKYSDVWQFNTSSGEGTFHPAQKPVALMAHIIHASTRDGATLLDPFMGSGTTLLVAKNLRRCAIGIEISQQYCDITIKRLQQEVLPLEVLEPQASTHVQASLSLEEPSHA